MDAGTRGYFYGKDKLPEGWSYPLKRSVLDEALESAGVTSVVSVRCHYGGSPPLGVEFTGEEARNLFSGKVSITVRAVPSAERRATMAELESTLAVVCDWIRSAEDAAPTWRMTGHALAVEISDGHAAVVEF
jgi:hypothetical protein